MGLWNYIKNSGRFDADELQLEWIGALPGKRESRRFQGCYTLTQKDIENNRLHPALLLMVDGLWMHIQRKVFLVRKITVFNQLFPVMEFLLTAFFILNFPIFFFAGEQPVCPIKHLRLAVS